MISGVQASYPSPISVGPSAPLPVAYSNLSGGAAGVAPIKNFNQQKHAPLTLYKESIAGHVRAKAAVHDAHAQSTKKAPRADNSGPLGVAAAAILLGGAGLTGAAVAIMGRAGKRQGTRDAHHLNNPHLARI